MKRIAAPCSRNDRADGEESRSTSYRTTPRSLVHDDDPRLGRSAFAISTSLLIAMADREPGGPVERNAEPTEQAARRCQQRPLVDPAATTDGLMPEKDVLGDGQVGNSVVPDRSRRPRHSRRCGRVQVSAAPSKRSSPVSDGGHRRASSRSSLARTVPPISACSSYAYRGKETSCTAATARRIADAA